MKNELTVYPIYKDKQTNEEVKMLEDSKLITYSYLKDKYDYVFTVTPYEFYKRFELSISHISATFDLRPVNQYVLDMNKLNKSKDVNGKLNLLFEVLNRMQLIINDSIDLTDEIREYLKEV